MSLIATRQQIYSNEATDILHQISMYPGILEQQVCAFHPDKKAQVENLITYFIRQERIQREDNGSLYIIGCSPKPQKDVLIRSIWVLIDFLKDVEFHCAGDYPIMIVFLIKGKEYQIIYAEDGHEAIIGTLLNQQKDHTARRIILVDSSEQISNLIMPGIVGYCTVDPYGRIQYYKAQT